MLVSKNDRICHIIFENKISSYIDSLKLENRELLKTKTNKTLSILSDQIDEYFSKRRSFFNIKLDISMPPFYQKVLNEVMKIPYGEFRTYKEIATKTGNPNAYRAAGTANARNAIPIIIPCHRVLRNNGDIGGYGGGLKIKKYLLKMEGVI